MSRLLLAACVVLVLAGACSLGVRPDRRFATPEAALATYIDALRRGDRPAVEECFDTATGFHLSGPLAIESYAVRRRTIVDRARVRELKDAPFEQRPREGDVELLVDARIAGKDERYFYAFRRGEHGWKIYAHSAHGDL
jgi:hypothetical protein